MAPTPHTARSSTHQRGALVLAGLAGVSAWISLGTLALTGTHGTRIGALPPLWAAVTFVLAAIAAAWVLRLKTCESWPLALSALLWAPWSPFPTPPALLVWEGPLEGLVWIAAVGGVILARGFSREWRPPRLWANAKAGPWLAGTLMLACALAAAASLKERLPGGDEPHYLIITQSLLRDGDLRIQNNHDRGDYLEYVAHGVPPDYLRRGINGEIYSIHAPGLSALLVPVFAIAGYPGAVAAMALLGALCVAACWRAAYNLTVDVASAWAASLAFAFSAPFFLHAFTIFPDPAAAAIVAVALAVVVQLDVAPLTVRTRHVTAVGVLLGVLPWLHTRFSLIAGMAGLVIGARLFQLNRWASLSGLSAGPVLCAAGWFLYFRVVYGTVDPAAPYGGSRQNALSWMMNGVTGLLFDQQFGLLANAPVMVLVPLGLFRLWRARPRLTVELVMIAAPYVGVITTFGMWWGGWSAPARFLVAVLPLAVPALAYAWMNAGAATRCAFVALTLIGCANVAARVVLLDGLLLYNFRDGYDVLLDWLSRAVNLPLALPSVHRAEWRLALLVACIWLACGVAAFGALSVLFKALRRVMSRPPSRSVGVQWAVTSAILMLAATIAMTAVWRLEHADALTVESSKIDFIHRWEPYVRPVALAWPPLRRVPLEAALHDIEVGTSVRARDTGNGHPLLAIARVPAADYRVVVEGAPQLAGTLTVSIGLTSQPIETWALDGLQSGETGLLVRLPVQVHSLVVRGDDLARTRITRLALRPDNVAPRPERPRGFALRAARYGIVRAFLLDDWLYMEPDGMWTRGNSVSKLVLTSDGDTWAELDLQAGPVTAVVALAAGRWSLEHELAAGERRRIRVPAGEVLRVQTTGGFRPVDYNPANRDLRLLGIRLEFPEPAGGNGSTVHGPTSAVHGPRSPVHGPPRALATTSVLSGPAGPRSTVNGPRATVHGPRSTVHGSRRAAIGSQFPQQPPSSAVRRSTVHGPRFTQGGNRIAVPATTSVLSSPYGLVRLFSSATRRRSTSR